MKTKPKTVTFTTPEDIEVIVLAQLGRSNRRICQDTGLTDSQVSYRLSRAKNRQGFHKFHTYRSEWRNGTSALAMEIEARYLAPLRKEVKVNVTPLFQPENRPSKQPIGSGLKNYEH